MKKIQFPEFQANLTTMRPALAILFTCILAIPLDAEVKRTPRKSLLDSEPGVVYLEQASVKPLELKVIREAPVFSDKEGKHQLGTLAANQIARIEAITDKVYRVRGMGTRGGIAGWVAPWAFSPNDPEFAAKLKQFYDRQIQVQELIAANQIACGMTMEEISRVLGKPTKTSSRKTETGETATWEYVRYEEVKHYITRVDPTTRTPYRQLSHITQEEKSRINVDFENQIATAIEESKDHSKKSPRILLPPWIPW
jgi:hypothetical protein